MVVGIEVGHTRDFGWRGFGLDHSVAGAELVAELATRHPGAAVIVVTADEREDEHVRGLRLGADDVIAKPFRVANLLARVEAVPEIAVVRLAERDIVRHPLVASMIGVL